MPVGETAVSGSGRNDYSGLVMYLSRLPPPSIADNLHRSVRLKVRLGQTQFASTLTVAAVLVFGRIFHSVEADRTISRSFVTVLGNL